MSVNDVSLRLVLSQIDTCVGDIAGNAAAVREAVRKAADDGAGLVVFPEMTLVGYPIEDLALRASYVRTSQQAVVDLARTLDEDGLGDVAVVVGHLDLDADTGRPTNSAAVLRAGSVQADYAKVQLPNYGVFDEYRIFSPGHGPCIVDIDGLRVAVLICEDLWIDGGIVADVAAAAPDLVVVPNGSPFEQGKVRAREELAARRAREMGAPLAYVNLVGGQDDLVFDGGSFVTAADGTVVARAPQFASADLTVDIVLPGRDTAVAERAERIPAEVRGGRIAPALDPLEETYRAIVLGLRDYVVKNGFRSVVLGLSGGIDSALVAAISADAIGGENIVGVSMPSAYSSEHSKDDAADLADRIGADYRVVPIGGNVETFLAGLPVTGVSEENLQARLRGVTLMALSNEEGHLVLATGNKSELAVGYSTIYGDAVGGFAPLKDVLKTEVWALSRWRNNHAIDRGEIPPIPESSITKPPSAELRPGQLDQDSLPEYDLLDRVIEAYVEHGLGRAELIALGLVEGAVDKVVGLVDRAEWKRRQYPPGPKVTALAFGRDRRLPITSRWREIEGA